MIWKWWFFIYDRSNRDHIVYERRATYCTDEVPPVGQAWRELNFAVNYFGKFIETARQTTSHELPEYHGVTSWKASDAETSLREVCHYSSVGCYHARLHGERQSMGTDWENFDWEDKEAIKQLVIDNFMETPDDPLENKSKEELVDILRLLQAKIIWHCEQ